MKVNEIFYSLQGEGGNSGKAMIFIRLSGCNLSCSFCDTEFETGTEMTTDEILTNIKQYPCNNILWTGGEPTIQLTKQIVQTFKAHGYYQAIETNGMYEIPSNLDYITISPKISEKGMLKYNERLQRTLINEIKIVLKARDKMPEYDWLDCDNRFISPINDLHAINYENLAYCIGLVKKNAHWRLSMQSHKIWRIK